MQQLARLRRLGRRLLTGKTPADKRQALVDRFQQDDSVRVFLANIIAGGDRHQPDGGDAGRLQRSRLGAREPLAGRGSRLSHRPDAHGQRHLHGGRRHDRRLRPDRAREERPRSSARSSTARRWRRICRATCSTNCSARCARCRPGLRMRQHGANEDDLIERLLRQARLDLDASRPRRRGDAGAHARRNRSAQTRARGARQRALGRRPSSAIDSRARRTPASSTSSRSTAPTSRAAAGLRVPRPVPPRARPQGGPGHGTCGARRISQGQGQYRAYGTRMITGRVDADAEIGLLVTRPFPDGHVTSTSTLTTEPKPKCTGRSLCALYPDPESTRRVPSSRRVPAS